METQIDTEKLKLALKDCKKHPVIIFLNCKIENITITRSEIDFKECEQNLPGEIVMEDSPLELRTHLEVKQGRGARNYLNGR